MTPPPTPLSPRLTARRSPTPRLARRGGVYILVLGVSTLLTVVGLSAIALSRISLRQVTQDADADEAGVLARSAVQLACAKIASNPGWRGDYKNNLATDPVSLGRGTVTFRLVDEADAELNDGETPVRVYGTGIVGDARKVFSALLTPVPPPALQALKSTVHSGLGLTTSGTVRSVGGPVTSNLSLQNNGQLYSDAAAPTVSSSGFIYGYVETGAQPKTMPPLDIATRLAASPTRIPTSGLDSGLLTLTLHDTLLSPTFNKYGPTNASGFYTINVPALTTLTIEKCRIFGSLLIELGPGASLRIRNAVWDPAISTLPSLLVTGDLALSVSIAGGSPVLESSAGNLNPPATPYNGISDADTTDSYPALLRGLFHINALATVMVDSSTVLEGCILNNGAATIGDGATLTASSTLTSSPPTGYTEGRWTMKLVHGSYRWEVD